ncbi:chorismate synthase [Lachnospiraceae bacterium LCP25S3_G4]
MSSTYGHNIKISVFGQSHSKGIGVSIDGLPYGRKIDMKALSAFMERRAPGRDEYTTKRREPDSITFLSGLVDRVTCGAPLAAMISNQDTRSLDYKELSHIPRPSHADYTAQMKYGGAQDVAGGGHFSGRLTAPLCIAGGICRQFLKEEGVEVLAHIQSIGDIMEPSFEQLSLTAKMRRQIEEGEFPTLLKESRESMKKRITDAGMALDSVGGIIECMITGLPVGVGEPMFDGIENRIAGAIFAIPAIKGIEFGNGFMAAKMSGSQNNDSFYMEGDNIRTRTNRHGGILGGISSGMPIIFRVACKPTPSIGIEQKSVALDRKKDTNLSIKGRHDPCIVPRAVPCVEAIASLVIYDLLLDFQKRSN